MNTRVTSTAAWPQPWSTGFPKWVTISGIVMSVVVGTAFVLGLAGAAGIPIGVWFYALGAVFAVLLPAHRPDRLSAGVRMTGLDPRTGGIDLPGGWPGVLVPEHPRAAPQLAAMTALLVLTGPAMWFANKSDLEFPPYLVVLGCAMSVFGLYLAVTLTIRRSPARLVLTEPGFWINNSTSYAFVPWQDVRSVLPMRRGRNNFIVIQLADTASGGHHGKYFGFTHEPVVRKGVVNIGAPMFDLDAALLLYTLQFAGDPAYRRKFSSGEVIHDMRCTYPAPYLPQPLR